MKLNFLVVLLMSLPILLLSQITRTGSFVANDPGVYPISGDVTVSETGGVLTVVFESNFSTIQGLVLEVFLTKSKDLNTASDVKISTTPLDQGSATFTPITGMRTFIAPVGISIYDFDNIVVQCTSIDELWGHANFCEPDLDVSVNPIPSDRYVAETITSSAAVDVMADVTFEAYDNVELLSGFEVPNNTMFESKVGLLFGCNVE